MQLTGWITRWRITPPTEYPPRQYGSRCTLTSSGRAFTYEKRPWYYTPITPMPADKNQRSCAAGKKTSFLCRALHSVQARYYGYRIILSPNPLAQLTFPYRSVQHFFSSTDEH